MNKALLLASAACILTLSSTANAQQMFGFEAKPYIGADYVYTHADYKNAGNNLKQDYNSGAVNVGVRLGEFAGLEAFFQQSGQRKSNIIDVAADDHYKVKSKFNAYGLDLYGYLPLGCMDKVDLLASVGAGNYNLEVKNMPTGKYDKDHMGYRFGVGAQYNFTQNFSARAMYRYTYVDTKYLDNLNEVTAGLRYSF